MVNVRPVRVTMKFITFWLLAVVSAVGPATAQINSQRDLDTLARDLGIKWTVLTNTEEDYKFQAEVTLQNNAENLNLTGGPWEIHFSSVFRLEPDLLGIPGNEEAELQGQGVFIKHFQGGHYYFRPASSFISLVPGASRKIKLKINDFSVSRTDNLPNWYLTYPGLTPATLVSTVGESLDFVSPASNVQQWKRFGADEYNPYTPQDRYDRNYVEDFTFSSEIRVIPRPAVLKLPVGDHVSWLLIDSTWNVTYKTGADSEARYLAEKLSLQAGLGDGSGTKRIHLSIGSVDFTGLNTSFLNSSDVYSLTINLTSGRVDLLGQGASGLFYGVITLISLMSNTRQVPECLIVDGPRFQYRGLMLDVARSFHPKEEIIRLIQLMASYKLNHLHLHLTDDEGWRVEVPDLPELTQLGSQRCHDPQETRCLLPQLGSDWNSSSSYGNGYLTEADYVDILQAANQHHVTVIPEVDMPGHSRAAILAMRLRNSSQPAHLGVQPGSNSTLLSEEDDPSVYTSPQFYSDNALNPCLESSYNFISIVMDRFIQLHKKGQQSLGTFHFGGDEVGRGAWENSTACNLLRQSMNFSLAFEKSYFFQRVSRLAANKNISLGAWEDGLMHDGNRPFNISLSPVQDIRAYAWNNVWESDTLARTYRLANQGYQVILAHASHLYIDHPYEPDPEERGSYWATRFTDTKKLFYYNAENYYDNVEVQGTGVPIPEEELCGPANSSCPPLTKPENIIGMEAALFSETVRTREHLHYMLFPRLLALAERAWHRASWESLPRGEERNHLQRSDWFSFARAVGYKELGRLDQGNVTYRVPPPGAVFSHGRLLLTPLYPGALVVQYSLNSGITWQDGGHGVALGDYKYRIWLRTKTQDGRRFSRTVVLDPNPQLKVTNQPVLDYIAQYLSVQYTVVDNYLKYDDDLYEAQIRLVNLGDETIPAGNWRVYFVSVNVIEPDSILQGREYQDTQTKLSLSHTQGYLYSLGPTPDFGGLAPGDSLNLTFRVQAWSVSRYEQMPRWYVSAPGMSARNLQQTGKEDLFFVTAFTRPQQWKRFSSDRFDPWTPEDRYNRNAAREVTPLPGQPIIPTPVNLTILSQKSLNLLNNSWTVVCAEDSLQNVCAYFVDTMKTFFPTIQLTINQTNIFRRFIQFRSANTTSGLTMNAEAYSISVHAATESVEVYGNSSRGVFYGAVSLVHMSLKSEPAASLPECQLQDWPRFPYRGMHLDTARNFMPKASVLKLLRVMSLYKLNKLHLHLSDDEGWRLQIPGLEELTQVGGRRCHDLEEKRCVMSTLGSGAGDDTSGSGFYTVEDYQDILRLAASLEIDVIPEFDMPGHAHAAIKAMRARQTRLRDLGDQTSADQYLLDDDQDFSYYYSVQYYTDNAVNPCLDSLFRFISEVYTRVKEIHKDIQPLKVYHFGGDEVAKGAWVNSTVCADLLRSGASLKRIFTQRVSAITKDVALAAWEDGLMDHQSLPWNRSLLQNQEIIVQAWQNVWEWGVAARAHNLANEGYKVVFSPVTHMYLDHPQEPDPEERGFYWGTRYTDGFKTFSFMPDHYYLNADIKRSGEPITMEEICGQDKSGCPPLNKPENIIGLQGQLWSESVRSPAQLEYMVFPRLLALAERAWHRADWEGLDVADRQPGLKSDWARFAHSLGSKDLGLLDVMGVAYRVPPPGARLNDNTISVKVEYPGLNVQYRVGNDSWNLWNSSVIFQKGQEVTLRTMSSNGSRFSTEIQVLITETQSPTNTSVPISSNTPVPSGSNTTVHTSPHRAVATSSTTPKGTGTTMSATSNLSCLFVVFIWGCSLLVPAL